VVLPQRNAFDFSLDRQPEEKIDRTTDHSKEQNGAKKDLMNALQKIKKSNQKIVNNNLQTVKLDV
jgi:hypothetical protein